MKALLLSTLVVILLSPSAHAFQECSDEVMDCLIRGPDSTGSQALWGQFGEPGGCYGPASPLPSDILWGDLRFLKNGRLEVFQTGLMVNVRGYDREQTYCWGVLPSSESHLTTILIAETADGSCPTDIRTTPRHWAFRVRFTPGNPMQLSLTTRCTAPTDHFTRVTYDYQWKNEYQSAPQPPRGP